MKRCFFLIIIASILITGCTSRIGGTREERAARDAAHTLAREFVTELSREDYAKARSQFTDLLLKDMTIRDMEMFWIDIMKSAGSFNSVTAVDGRFENDAYITILKADHANRIVEWELTYITDSEGSPKLSGITAAALYKQDERVPMPPDRIIQETIVVGEASGYPLSGRLTLPADIEEGTQIPAVVLVHDFGVWDMDASVFDNKPFRDIAYHLAENGIAVLRYDKITYRYPQELERIYGNAMTVELETVFDAAYARMFLADDERIDQDRVYVLGHGLGGSLAAYISGVYGYNGWISMAGTPRNLLELAIDSELFAMVRDGRNRAYRDSVRADIETAVDLFNILEDISLEEPVDLEVFGLSGHYLKSLLDNPPNYYMQYAFPALVLQGTNDFEVFFDRDFKLFQTFLEDNPIAEFRLYDGVNHMFMWSTMEHPDIRDYQPAATVEKNVMNDIVMWINVR